MICAFSKGSFLQMSNYFGKAIAKCIVLRFHRKIMNVLMWIVLTIVFHLSYYHLICRTTIQSVVLPFNLSNYHSICRTTMQYVVLPNTILYIQFVVLFRSNRFLFWSALSLCSVAYTVIWREKKVVKTKFVLRIGQ
jgi:hypothetical protein